ncbi:MAG: hypothetical protein LBH42_06695, partial [Treponema sp.]|nr:hypothetical protein [Treponema sp.]
MDFLIPVLAAIVGIVLVVFLLMMFRGRTGKSGGGGKLSKGRDSVLKEASKRLEQNPRDPEALSALGDLYYREENWDQAYKTYGALSDLGKQAPNEFEANLRWGMSALKLGLTDEALKGLTVAKNLNSTNFEVSYNLG